ncbi:hypothetical protein [Halorubrum sp. DTA46]|uniref:hypothetical protein n=1 Tax=Halorubrum sp. DTA46 TaxID=3402162 RepID=UPI003AAF901B
MSTNLLDGGGGEPDAEPPESEEFIDDGSIRWAALTETAAGAFVTLVAIAIADFLNLVSTGVVAYMTAAGESIGGVVRAPFVAGESVITTSFASAAAFVPSLGIFAFPAAVVIVVASVLLVLWGVNRFVR